MSEILVSDNQMVRAFVQWERLFRENPRGFLSTAEVVLTRTPEQSGKACGDYFKMLLIDAR